MSKAILEQELLDAFEADELESVLPEERKNLLT